MLHRIGFFVVGAAVSFGLAGSVVADPGSDRIDLSGAGFGAGSIPGESFGFANAATSSSDSMMSTLVFEDTPEGGTPTAAPLPVSGALGAVGLGLLAARRRRPRSL